MKLNFPLLDESLIISGATILTIEPTHVFAKLVKAFYGYHEESELRLFDDQQKSLKDSELLVITDILGFDLNSPTVIKLIHADLEHQFNDKPEVKAMIEKLAATITELISYECLENELDLEHDDITITELIKALGVKVETQSDTVFEKCFEILQVFRYLNKKRLLVFVNSGAYLTQDEVLSLMDYIALSQLKVLFLEPRRLYNFPQYVLDEDYFLLGECMI